MAERSAICPHCAGPMSRCAQACLACYQALGLHHPPGNRGEIAQGPILKAVTEAIEAGDSWSQIARRAGWPHKKGGGDTSALKRRLGLIPTPQGGRPPLMVSAMRYETALKIVRAIGRAPSDFAELGL